MHSTETDTDNSDKETAALRKLQMMEHPGEERTQDREREVRFTVGGQGSEKYYKSLRLTSEQVVRVI